MVKITDPIGWDKFTETEKEAVRYLKKHGPFKGAAGFEGDVPEGSSEADIAPAYTAAGAFGILLHAPMHSLGLWTLGRAPWARMESGENRAWDAYEHEWVDEVLAIDSGNYSLTDLHLPLAIAAGIRPDAVLAVLNDDLDALTDEELHFVKFIRQTAAGHMEDEVYAWMKKRLGSDYAVIDYMMLILILVVHTRLMSLFDYPGPSREDFVKHIEELRAGRGLIDPDEYEEQHIERFNRAFDWLFHLDDNGFIKKS